MSMSEAFLCHYRFNKMSTTQSSEWLRLSLVLEFNLLLCGPWIWLNTVSFHLSIGRSEETLLRKSQLSRLPRSQRGSPVAILERASEMQGQPVQEAWGWACLEVWATASAPEWLGWRQAREQSGEDTPVMGDGSQGPLRVRATEVLFSNVEQRYDLTEAFKGPLWMPGWEQTDSIPG